MKIINSLSISQFIIKSHKEINKIRLVAHPVYTNWRQVYKNPDKKLAELKSSFIHPKFIKEKILTREQFISMTQKELTLEANKIGRNIVWSISSKVICKNNVEKHIPMMNFHPEGISKKGSIPYLKKAIKHTVGIRKGFLLDSGRYYHYYGNFLLKDLDWLKFLASFLMPCILVSPRYIGHCINQDFAVLRLTPGKDYKTHIPQVVESI